MLFHLESDEPLPEIIAQSANCAAIKRAFELSLPGKRLEVSLLVNKKKKFRARGGRDGALDVMRRLEEDGTEKLAVPND